MKIERFDIAVAGAGAGDGWRVVPRGLDGTAAASMGALSDGGRRYPAAAGGVDAATITRTIRELRDGAASNAAVVALGRHLFGALLAPMWPAITKRLDATDAPAALELALDLDGAPELAGLPWELMHSGDGFLASGWASGTSVIDLVITRRTARRPVAAEPLGHPLRYLFVIGDELDDRLRAGAECLGLLRQIGPQMQDRILLLRSASRSLEEVVDEFRPHVVHFICHGVETEDGEVRLELYDRIEQKVRPTAGHELIDALVRARSATTWCPTAVVMSACSSGNRLAAAGQGDLAAALVAAGIPVVIGMSAEIGDLACRLFTRKLGAAVVGGAPLLVAAARGRRAALRHPEVPHDSFDWGLINVVIGADQVVPIEVPPVEADETARGVMQRIDRYSLAIDRRAEARTIPPFCGRAEVVAAFYEMMAGRGQAVMCLMANQPASPDHKVGKRRTLNELAAVALRAGWIPVMVIPRREGQGMPRSVPDLLKRIAESIRKARTAHELTTAGLAIEAELARGGELAPYLAREALARDLTALRDDARARHAFVAERGGEVVVFVNDVHLYGDAVQPLFVDLLEGQGLGVQHRIPVVLTYVKTGRDGADRLQVGHDQLVEELITRTDLHRFRELKLTPFSGHEEVLAYQRLLLHPFRNEPDYAAKRYFLDLRSRSEEQKVELERVVRFLNNGGLGYPGAFLTPSFLLWLREAIQLRTAIRDALDDDILRSGGVA